MKAIMVMFDSLNRRYLPAYGNKWIKAPNFERLQEKTVVFDNCYAGSLPCMPARRELQTGRYNFLHRSWGPMEPYDDSVFEILKKKGVYTHLTSDHTHYWEDGGATYHTRYNSWEISRGQEGDPWKGHVKAPEIPDCTSTFKIGDLWRQDWVNRTYLTNEWDQPQALTFENGLNFIEQNKNENNWFLQIETFDPHEPFFTQDNYKELYPHSYEGKHNDWPDYGRVRQSSDEVDHVRYEYAALISMCDNYLGKVLDMMDDYDLWKDTMLIVNTDHGYMLGEKEWWGKNIQPFYNEVVQTPLFIWDPRTGIKNERRQALVQTIDLPATLLEYFALDIPKDMEGKSLKETILSDKKVRECALFGLAGGHINVTDGRYVYMRGPVRPDNKEHYEYTLMPTHMNQMFQVNELQDIELQEPFEFTKNCRLMKIKSNSYFNPYWYGTRLYDLAEDPEQLKPYRDFNIEEKMIKLLVNRMKENDAPVEQYERIGVSRDIAMSSEDIRQQVEQDEQIMHLTDCSNAFTSKAKVAHRIILTSLDAKGQLEYKNELCKFIIQKNPNTITMEILLAFVSFHFTESERRFKFLFNMIL
ncbi:sulfatase [Vallitalea pronyensis]|uniref:Sulfatase n=1 Tax=Vallitalea pronyensis TaxID=1348613 RepID=A0A8J8SIR8_9FIRM|nr:sulfatase [Vallitalea pronyensis]